MSNKNKELAAAVYKEMFPTVEDMEHELTRTHGKRYGGDRRVPNQQVLITSSDSDKN